MQQLAFNTREDFRRWLEHHHDKEDGLWLVYYKKKTGIPTITYDEAVEEALCFGWIDSKVQSVDELRYRQIFTPRRSRSVWSVLNKKRVKKMMDAGLMTPAGLKAIEKGKESGAWQKAYGANQKVEMPAELKTALMQNPLAWKNFNNFAPSYRHTYIAWVAGAKRHETVEKRIEKVVEYSLKNRKPGVV